MGTAAITAAYLQLRVIYDRDIAGRHLAQLELGVWVAVGKALSRAASWPHPGLLVESLPAEHLLLLQAPFHALAPALRHCLQHSSSSTLVIGSNCCLTPC